MGDRANVLVKQDADDPGVYLYTHWSGTELPTTLQAALAKRWRWNDAAYLARIIFDQMTEGWHGQETGFGISTIAPDGQGRVLVVNCDKQTVSCLDKTWTFEEFLALDYLAIKAHTWQYGQ